MKYLLDTHILLWAAGQVEKLSPTALQLIEESSNELFFSAVSIWEVAIKSGLGRADFQVDPYRFRTELLANGYQELPLTSRHAAMAGDLPNIHKDPFDRILIIQARLESMVLLTADQTVADYGEPSRLI